MVLIEKNLPFELVEIDVYNKPDWFSSVSPYGKVPVLSHEGNTLYESAIINEYLDEVFPDIPLMPDNYFQRAKARIWIDYCSNRYLPACSQLMRDRNNPQEQEKNLENLREIFFFMERECFEKNNGGVFWMGENITLVDLHFAPFLSGLELMKICLAPDGLKNVKILNPGGQPCRKGRVTKILFYP